MMEAILVVFAGMMGAAVGSFLNVVLSRLPRGESLVQPGSHCPACGRILFWWENIPVFSFMALGGQCRTCRAPIGYRHLIIEVAAAGVAATAAAFVLKGGARVG